jgi:hypothetical protein
LFEVKIKNKPNIFFPKSFSDELGGVDRSALPEQLLQLTQPTCVFSQAFMDDIKGKSNFRSGKRMMERLAIKHAMPLRLARKYGDLLGKCQRNIGRNKNFTVHELELELTAEQKTFIHEYAKTHSQPANRELPWESIGVKYKSFKFYFKYKRNQVKVDRFLRGLPIQDEEEEDAPDDRDHLSNLNVHVQPPIVVWQGVSMDSQKYC